MPEVRYGGKQGQTVELEVDPRLVAVRTRSRKSLRAGPVRRPESALLDELEFVFDFPEAGVEIYRQRDNASRSLDDTRRALRNSPETSFAGRVLVDKQSREPVVYTENLFVKFADDAEPDTCQQVLREQGLTVKRELPYATNSYFVAAPEGTGQKVFDIAKALLARDDVESAQPELVRRLGRRQISPNQWHLQTTMIGGQSISASANVAAAHALSLGENVTIAIIDTGIDFRHEEFSSPGKIVAPRDTTSSDNDPSPASSRENHGTACAGVACADGRFQASGVAPRARLMPIRMVSQLGSQSEADAFFWAAQHGADIISCSWGPADGDWWDTNDPMHQSRVPLADSTRHAIDWALTNGRGGKGCLIFFAAGNGNESVDNDGYASYEKVIAVAACNDRGKRAIYSDFGKAVFCTFPSNDMELPEENHPAPLTAGIWTTDRTGFAGYSRDNYTNSFGGTSSACPGAAGVAALVLAHNPALRADEVKDVLRRACDRIDPQGGEYDGDGHSPFYGYGRLNAEAAVRLATGRPQQNAITVVRTFSEPITDMHTSRVAVEIAESAAIADIRVQVAIEHTYIGDLVVSLLPPRGTTIAPIVLHKRSGGRTHNLVKTYDRLNTPALAGCLDTSARGLWTLEVRDEAAADVGTIRSFGLELGLKPAVRRPPRLAAA